MCIYTTISMRMVFEESEIKAHTAHIYRQTKESVSEHRVKEQTETRFESTQLSSTRNTQPTAKYTAHLL